MLATSSCNFLIRNWFMGGESYALSQDLVQYVAKSETVLHYTKGKEDKKEGDAGGAKKGEQQQQQGQKGGDGGKGKGNDANAEKKEEKKLTVQGTVELEQVLKALGVAVPPAAATSAKAKEKGKENCDCTECRSRESKSEHHTKCGSTFKHRGTSHACDHSAKYSHGKYRHHHRSSDHHHHPVHSGCRYDSCSRPHESRSRHDS